MKAATQRITEGLQHRREYEGSNPTSQTLGTLSENNMGICEREFDI